MDHHPTLKQEIVLGLKFTGTVGKSRVEVTYDGTFFVVVGKNNNDRQTCMIKRIEGVVEFIRMYLCNRGDISVVAKTIYQKNRPHRPPQWTKANNVTISELLTSLKESRLFQ